MPPIKSQHNLIHTTFEHTSVNLVVLYQAHNDAKLQTNKDLHVLIDLAVIRRIFLVRKNFIALIVCYLSSAHACHICGKL